eukprot:TRINITY_DN1312_c0_g1_i1.p1 TRINITY_DN1312_c0_g1~~TRINITY_DN1312_c0_g1_i1.p1  ORF type:complete len:601 (+),score=228.22 TRINITY_DN1312_c0_g1_i1:75-1805(+)
MAESETVAPLTAVQESADEKGPSKKALKKAEKEAQKAQAKAAKQQQQQAAKPKEEESSENYGVLPLNQSADRPGRKYVDVSALDESLAGQTVLVQARVNNSRGKGNLVFLVLRQSFATVQAVVAKSGDVTKGFVAFAAGLSKETIVAVEGTVTVPKEKIETTSQQTVEILVTKLHVVSAAATLPMQLEDAARPKKVFKEQEARVKALELELEEAQKKLAGKEGEEAKPLQAEVDRLIQAKSEAQKYSKVSRDTRLNNRTIDLRTPANQAIFRVQSGVCQLFREFLSSEGFTEIHTPKLIGAASEGGADVFKVTYFETFAYLAQSPQLYKQMAICADLERVFEIGSVFRAEKSFTYRHLTEFIGLDLEMQIKEHYYEVLDVLDALFNYLFTGLTKRYAKELAAVNVQFPYTPLKWTYPSLRLKFPEAVALLRENGVNQPELEDLSTENERTLGRLVKEKYDTDFFILDKFPKSARPFYTMVDPADERYTNSYDFFIRGAEILSGAQRVHDAAMLTKRAGECGVPVEGIKDYVNSFKYGAPPHAGGGIGLERVVMLFLGLTNIRQTSMFPRDPKRLAP